MMKWTGETINIIHKDIHKQSGTNDCGLFAIAVCLASGEDPSTFKWNQKLMWDHYYKCLIDEKLTMFPGERTRHSKKSSKSTETKIYCICRMPWMKRDMIHCPKCKDWFHDASFSFR